MSLSREETIRMAMEATEGSSWKPGLGNEHVIIYLERFFNSAYAAGAAAERKACAEICDRFQSRDVGMQPAECADAIRARGDK